MKKLRWLLGFIDAAIGKGCYETAKRLRSTCSQVFRYAIATARADRDVASDLRGALIVPKPVHRAHSAPVSCQSLAILRAIERDADDKGFLFPSRTSADRPMSENTINAALRRMGYAHDQMTGQGFRAMAATLLNEMGLWHAEAIERQLAHCDNNAVRRAYTRGEYWDERVRMMQHCSDHLDFLRDGATVPRGKFSRANPLGAAVLV